MLFDFEPSGINDTYLRLTRRGVSCIVAPAGAWNGLLRVNYIVAGSPGGADPHMIYRCLDIGWDDGRFCWKGRAAPVMTTSAMVDILQERGLVTSGEAERLLFGINSSVVFQRSQFQTYIRKNEKLRVLTGFGDHLDTFICKVNLFVFFFYNKI